MPDQETQTDELKRSAPEEPVVIRPDIRPTDDQLRDLSVRLSQMVEEAEEFKGNWDQITELNWNQYLCVPDQEVKTYPWERASNFFAPLTRVTVDSLMAEYYDAMFGSRPRAIGLGVEDEQSAKDIDSYYFDYLFQQVLKLPFIGNDWNMSTLVDGTSCVVNRWNRDFAVRRFDETIIKPEIKRDKTESLGQIIETEVQTGWDVKTKEKTEVYLTEQPEVELVDLNRLFVAPGTTSALESPSLQWPQCKWYYQDTFWDEATLRQRKREGFWITEDDIETFKGLMREPEPTLAETARLDQSETGLNKPESLPIKVFYMRLVLPGEIYFADGSKKEQRFDAEDGYAEECIVWFAPDAGEDFKRILMIKPLGRVRPDGKRPHIINHYTRIPKHFFGIGLPLKLRQINRLINNTFNQRADWGALQNLPFFFYNPVATGLMPDITQMAPGQGIPIGSGNVTFPRFQGNPQFWSMQIQEAMAWAERESKSTDFQMGRSSSLPNAPRTARGMSMMLQQGSQFFGYMVQLLSEPYIELFRQIHALHRKHFPQQRIVRFLNRETGAYQPLMMTRGMFEDDFDFQFQLNPNRSYDQQRAMTLAQMLTPILMQMGNLNGIRELYRDVHETHGKKNFDQIWPPMMPPQVGMGMMGQPPMGGQPPMMPEGGMNPQMNPIAPAAGAGLGGM